MFLLLILGSIVANSNYALVNPSASKELHIKDETNEEDNNITNKIEAIKSNTNTEMNNNMHDKNEENISSGNLKVNLIQLYRELKEQKKLLELQYFHLLQQEKDLSTMYEDFNAADDPSAIVAKENYARNLSLPDHVHPIDNSNDQIQRSSSHDKEMIQSDRINVDNSRSESNKLYPPQNEYSAIDDRSGHYDVNPSLKLTTDSILFKKPYDKSLTNRHLATSSDQVNIDQLQQRIIENQYLIRDYLRSLEKSIESSSTNILSESQDVKETNHKSLHSNTYQDSVKDPLKYHNKLIPSKLLERNDAPIEQHNADYSSQSGRDSPSKLRHSNVNLDDSDSDNLIDIALSQIKHRKQMTNRDSENSNLKDIKYDYDELSTGYISSPLSPKHAFRLNDSRLVPHEEGSYSQIR